MVEEQRNSQFFDDFLYVFTIIYTFKEVSVVWVLHASNKSKIHPDLFAIRSKISHLNG